jgi:hypothetical protein
VVGFFLFDETSPKILAERRARQLEIERETQSLLHPSKKLDQEPEPATTAESEAPKVSMLQAMNDRGVITAVVAYGLTAFTAIMHDEVYAVAVNCLSVCLSAYRRSCI